MTIAREYLLRPMQKTMTKLIANSCFPQYGTNSMARLRALVMAALMGTLGVTEAKAECEIADAKLEEAIQQNPRLRGPANSQSVRDLRSLRDAAFTLRSYGRHEDYERLLANIRELIAGPPMGSLGDNDEEEADKQNVAREPKIKRGAALGSRDKKDAKPLLRIDELAPGLRTDEMIGAEVRSSDDKIVGEVRNIVFGTKDGRDYAIVASGGFFTTGKDSIVVPIRSFKVTQDRSSFFLPISKEVTETVPLMPDQDYLWLSDQKWRTHNDALFLGR
jgi:sporulation protein YlmC with PRC-barrel domain